MVKPPDVFPNYRIRELWKGSQAGAPKWWSRQWRVCNRRVGMYLCSEGKRVHPYGGAAAMRDGVMNLAFLYAPSSSPNKERMNLRRSPRPKLHSTEPRRPTASPTTLFSSTCPCPPCLIQPAHPKQALAMRVPPQLPSKFHSSC